MTDECPTCGSDITGIEYIGDGLVLITPCGHYVSEGDVDDG